jgi:phosphoribosyl 1,2-cyclic phosphodiesterase
MSGGERVGHRGVRGGGREEIRSQVGPTTDFSTTHPHAAHLSGIPDALRTYGGEHYRSNFEWKCMKN